MTQEEAMQILTDMGLHEGGMDNWVADNAWWKFANLVAQHEREACAKIADSQLRNTNALLTAPLQSSAAYQIGVSIRARGQA